MNTNIGHKHINVKLKPESELSMLLKAPIINDLLKVSTESADGTIKVRTTSNPEVFVEVQTGWTIHECCIDYVVYDCDSKDTYNVKSGLEPAEGTFNTYPNPNTPKEFREATEPLSPIIEYPFNVSSEVGTQEPFKMTKSMFNKVAIQRHRTHYVKLDMKDPNLSFRFFYESEDNKHQEGKWFLKDHAKKVSIEVNKEFIEKHFEDITSAFEIIGRLLPKKGYKKIVKNLVTNTLEEIKE